MKSCLNKNMKSQESVGNWILTAYKAYLEDIYVKINFGVWTFFYRFSHVCAVLRGDNDNFCLEMTIARLMWTWVVVPSTQEIMLCIMGSKLDIEWLSNMQSSFTEIASFLRKISILKIGHCSNFPQWVISP